MDGLRKAAQIASGELDVESINWASLTEAVRKASKPGPVVELVSVRPLGEKLLSIQRYLDFLGYSKEREDIWMSERASLSPGQPTPTRLAIRQLAKYRAFVLELLIERGSPPDAALRALARFDR